MAQVPARRVSVTIISVACRQRNAGFAIRAGGGHEGRRRGVRSPHDHARSRRPGTDPCAHTRCPSHSLGQFYAAITAYLGFRPDHDEYIVMGLAAYGVPRFATTCCASRSCAHFRRANFVSTPGSWISIWRDIAYFHHSSFNSSDPHDNRKKRSRPVTKTLAASARRPCSRGRSSTMDDISRP